MVTTIYPDDCPIALPMTENPMVVIAILLAKVSFVRFRSKLTIEFEGWLALKVTKVESDNE